MWKSIRCWADLIIPLISAAGTIYLGYIATKQNSRILKLEENSFISKHSCTGFVQEIRVNYLKELGHRRTSITALKKQVMKSNALNLNKDNSNDPYYLDLDLKMDINGALPEIYRIIKLTLFINKPVLGYYGNKEGTPYHFSSISDKFSKAIVYKDGMALSICLLLDDDEVEDFKNELSNIGSALAIDLELILVTNERVESKLLCRSRMLRLDDYVDIFNTRKVSDNAPSYIWKGNRILKIQDIDYII